MSNTKSDIGLSSASLILSPTGVCKGVNIDGHWLPNIASARIVMEPSQTTRLVVEILVSNVETIRDPSEW